MGSKSGDGGSGIIIIRYLTPSTSSTIELLRGTTTDANHDWKLGNYSGVFKVISSVSSVDTDRLVVSSAGDVEIGTRQWPNIPGTNIFRANGNALVNSVLRFGLAYNGSFGSFPCNKLNFYPLVGYGAGIGLGNTSLDYFTGNPFTGGFHSFYTGSTDTSFGTERMTISNTGVSIINKLSIGTDVWHGSSEGYNRVNYGNGSTTYLAGGNSQDSSFIFRRSNDDGQLGFITSGGTMRFTSFSALSDSRIKTDIEEINDDEALNKILLVQPTTYYYIDETRNKGNGKVYGFIAQQIKEVIPDAVMINKEIIPNIYKICLVHNKREIYHSIPQDIVIDTEVQIKDKDGIDGGRYKIKEIYDDYFVVDKDIDADEVFVFGYAVDDIHSLDKQYIFTLNVCATQELHRRIEAQDKRIKELEEKVERLLNYISVY